ncbi:hypothetical protein [Anaerococcus porci]|uniref:Uncharacterized protein n=1 Tax=Anaerococcus porci TaxID=2652269 RepID=A0A6N7VCB1_9FIRM|nr:hypothetical protein [Anaerococcus porci]MDY3005970.1 hypothetical protein [Anaerococcus porci]MSS77090.1 hypothetical protein [Anaerococcus porci]
MDIIKDILLIDDKTFALFLLDQDFLSRKIKNKKEIIRKSMECGFSFANKYKSYSIKDLLERFNLKVVEDCGSENFSYYELAFFEKPNQIHLCKNNIKKVEDKIISLGLNINVEDIVLAHEIFHKIEQENKYVYTDNIYIESFKLGPIKKKNKLKSSSEIGAMAFSKEFLSLSFNPVLIDYFLSLAFNKENVFLKKINYYRSKNES